MSLPERGEVWLVDLGFAAKVRPVLGVSVPHAVTDYALIQVIPHTTQARGAQFEVQLPVAFLQSGAFNVQVKASTAALKISASDPDTSARRKEVNDNVVFCGVPRHGSVHYH
jgi:hypothetical protein